MRASAAATRAREAVYPFLLLLPALATLVAVALVPFLYTVTLSFRQMSYTTPGPFVGLDNYVRLLTDRLFWNAMGITGLIIGAAVPLEFLAGLGLALLLHRAVAEACDLLDGVKVTDELAIVNSGLEDTMIVAYQEIREMLRRQPQMGDLRTAAFVMAINKVAIVYEELGIFP